ncbi:MAG: dTDP-4-dehydrorhamnose 3,5-epimerase [Anaerolineaceae bacterium]|nr:dTDP-4-dehydrorhamnose 3,5-epimerase [Anaerolineaceae bacterium]
MGNFYLSGTEIKDLYVIEVKRFFDTRGYFLETFREDIFTEIGMEYHFVQDNQSLSQKGVLRGLHFQKKHPQAKLMRVIRGEIFDVAVDLRRSSETFGQWHAEILSEENNRQLLVPRGFAHGFAVLSDFAEIAYKCDEYYHPEDEGGILWNDPDIGIKWPDIGSPILSEKDRNNPTLKEAKFAFS